MKIRLPALLLFTGLILGANASAQSAAERRSTASSSVSVMDTAFFIPQLNRYRRVWIYLPPGYRASRKKYPVLYLQDGQNVFDARTSFAGEWGVDEALDSLGRNMQPCIVVAVDNGAEKRLSEYSPYDFTLRGRDDKTVSIAGEGKKYADFLVETLQPYVKKNYRARKCGKHHFIAGSSMGGLISLYAVLRHPKKWGGAGVFSPSFWIARDSVRQEVQQRGRKVKGKIYFYAGKQESEEMVTDMLAVFAQLHKLSKAKMTTVIRTEGKHNEATWRQEFPLFYQWLFVD